MHTDRSTVLVTGGTGSFGSTMVRRLLDSDVAEVRVLSRDELKQDDMRRRLADERVRFYLGDVRDYDSVDRATRGVDYVFHAAALKQVPSCEFFPLEAVRTNVLGSANVIEASNANEVRSVVCLGHRQGGLPRQRDGDVQGADGEGRPGLRPQQPDGRHRGLHGALRQRDVLARLGDPAVRRADPGRPAADPDRPGDDPVPDEPRRGGAAGRARLRARPPRRPVHPQGAGEHDRGPGPRGRPGARASSRR